MSSRREHPNVWSRRSGRRSVHLMRDNRTVTLYRSRIALNHRITRCPTDFIDSSIPGFRQAAGHKIRCSGAGPFRISIGELHICRSWRYKYRPWHHLPPIRPLSRHILHPGSRRSSSRDDADAMEKVTAKRHPAIAGKPRPLPWSIILVVFSMLENSPWCWPRHRPGLQSARCATSAGSSSPTECTCPYQTGRP